MIYGLNKGLQWKSTISFCMFRDSIRWKQDIFDNPYNILRVNLRDSKDVETEILRDVKTDLEDVKTETNQD